MKAVADVIDTIVIKRPDSVSSSFTKERRKKKHYMYLCLDKAYNLIYKTRDYQTGPYSAHTYIPYKRKIRQQKEEDVLQKQNQKIKDGLYGKNNLIMT